MPKKEAPKKAAGKGRKATRKRGPAAPRGPNPTETPLHPEHSEVRALVASVEKAGGTLIGAYRDPYAGSPVVLASLPLKAVEPTPFQRDLSRTHADRLVTAIGAAGAFLDPVIAMPQDGMFWSPNGRHRLAAAKQLGQRAVTALVVSDTSMAYRILPLNTEKAHNLKDRSLEVIRMARTLAKERPRDKEGEHEVAFEAAFLLTLGAAYERRVRFAGSAYQPMLRRVDRFLDQTLPKALRQREQWAVRLLDVDDRVTAHVKALQEIGFRSPYLRTLVVARCNPVRWIPAKRGEQKPPMPMAEALQRMTAAARKFNPKTVRAQDLALVGAVAPTEE